MIAPFPLDKESSPIARDGDELLFYTPSHARSVKLIDDEARMKDYRGAHITPFFTPGKRVSMFLAGPPGAGKSYFIAHTLPLLPDINIPIYLFTSVESADDQFASIPPEHLRRVRMNPEIVSKITLEKIRSVNNPSRSAVVVFDDVDKIRDRALHKEIFKLMEEILANGRSHTRGDGNIHIFITSHALNDYRMTKYSFENSEYAVIFPSSTPYAQIDRFLTKLGVGKDMIRMISSSGERTCLIHKTAPLHFFLGYHTLSLLH